MTIEVDWYLPDRIVSVRATGVTTTAEILEANPKINAFLQVAQRPVYLISDETGVEATQTNLASIRDSFKYLSQFNYVVSVGQGTRIGAFLTTTLANILGFQYRRVNTLSEAIAFLKDTDPTLNLQ